MLTTIGELVHVMALLALYIYYIWILCCNIRVILTAMAAFSATDASRVEVILTRPWF